ncbi:MAG: hypothetical protein JRG83_21380, partial [Deltaproteobacteria bacterium]|nr:hypothetical protein [Deltaproteobacteria bacterium]
MPRGPAMAGSLFSCFVAATAVECLTAAVGANTTRVGAALGLLLGLGIV